MTIRKLVNDRGIREVLHFTTNAGLIGVLQSGALKSRARLTEDEQLEYIFRPNSNARKDVAWLDWVNLSISRINYSFFSICSERWHNGADIVWCIVSFDPAILSHPDVTFTTTNNIYTGVQRGTGEAGLEALFSNRVVRWAGNTVSRDARLLQHTPTCEQAEVLYPQQVSTQFLRRVYVRSEEQQDEVAAQVAVTGHRELEVIVDPTIFAGGL